MAAQQPSRRKKRIPKVQPSTFPAVIENASAQTSQAASGIGWIRLWRGARRTSQFVSLAAGIFGFWVVVGTSLLLRDDIEDRQRERLAWALSRINEHQAGDTAKGSALTYLYSAGHDISNFNLSCEALGEWSAVGCQNRIVFADVRMIAAERTGWENIQALLRSIFLPRLPEPAPITRHSKVNLKHAEILRGIFSEQSFDDVNLSEARLSETRIIDSTFQGNFASATILNSTITGSRLVADFSNTSFIGVDISNSAILGLESHIDTIDSDNFRAWADALPRRFWTPDETREIEMTPLPSVYRGKPDTELYPPLKEEVLKGITLCAPPTREGAAVPLNDRTEIFETICEEVPAEEARSIFVSRFRNWFHESFGQQQPIPPGW